MVDGAFMVDGPSINHPQKAINHKSWLMGLLRKMNDMCENVTFFEFSSGPKKKKTTEPGHVTKTRKGPCQEWSTTDPVVGRKTISYY